MDAIPCQSSSTSSYRKPIINKEDETYDVYIKSDKEKEKKPIIDEEDESYTCIMSDKEKEKIFDRIIDREVLINLVKERPVLWNRCLEVYKDKIAKIAAWREICLILKEDLEEIGHKDRQFFEKCVVKRWTQIRDAWVKSLQTNKKCKKSGSGNNSSRPYKYHKDLTFLKPFIKICDGSIENNYSEEIEEEIKKPTAQQETFLNPPTRKRKGVNEVVYLIDQGTNGKDDRNLTFFKSILPSLTYFDDDQILDFQSGVIHLIQTIKRRTDYLDWSQNSNTVKRGDIE